MNLNLPLRRIGRDAARIAAAVAAVMLVGSAVRALPPGTPPAGAVTLNPATGNSGTSIALTFVNAPQFCPGDAVAGFRWTTFLVPRATDLASMTYSPSGNPQAPAFSSALRTAVPGGVLVRAQNPGLGDGLVVPPLAIDFANIGFSSVTPGEYWIGIACTKSDGTVVQTEKFWSAPITIQTSAGAGPNNFTYSIDGTGGTTTTVAATTTTTAGATTTTVAGATTTTVAGATTTTVAGATTTTVAGATTTTVAGGVAATVLPTSPTPGGSYRVTYPNCQVGETITFSQPQSTPATTTAPCVAAAALTSSSQPQGFRRPLQATTGTATGSFTGAPTTPGTYTVTMTGTASPQRTVTFTVSATSTGTGTSGGSATGSGGGATTSSGGGSIPATGSSATPVIVWGILLLVFGRMAILLGRKPTVRQVG